MKTIFFNYVIIIFYLISSGVSYSIERPDIKNLIVHKDKKKIENIEFIKSEGQKVSLNDYKSNPIIINFWATWCAPCREEMPSLDQLMINSSLENLKIFPINVGNDDFEKTKDFFNDLKIKNLEPYFVSTMTLAKKLSLRGIPTTIFIDKEGKEFARVVGSIDFVDKKFLDWLVSFN